MTGDSTIPAGNRPMRSPYMTPEEIAGSRPFAFAADQSTPLERARQRMIATGQWNGAQAMGRRWAIGCVALEITQRCNLDCSLCYLSENAEAIRDVPLPELFRRIDEIRSIYGPKTDIQVTGGDPTLRRRDELVAIVRRIRDRGMRPALFTNGIRASRDLLSELAQAGLVDVAFHVDMTQGRRGYCSEVELNVLRRDYIEQARGLRLAVIFNTTVFAGNFAEIPGVAAFLTAHSDIVAFASFQLQADTGRGTERERASCITSDSVAEAICRGIGSRLSFGFPAAGHVRCNQYAMALVCNGRAYDFYDDRDFVTLALEATAGLQFERRSRRRAVVSSLAWALRHPQFIAPASRWLARKLWRMRYDLIAARGRINKISFFIHNFMDACRLERDRIDGCAFMVASADGPLSMCLHNARRDEFLLKPTRIATEDGPTFWNPVTGELQQDPQPAGAPEVPTRRRKGRGRV
ncbi:MAG: 7,8-dihydro-6-hydroxymethylpterin dimethyltransferase [Rhodospirillaceae bacterium]|nr:7,8-dihydro-6-hydroxymethylpterin dimethyltransferase [Rhodospirillaceae bacterium]